MSYNEEGLIRVKRGGCASKKHPDDKKERVELQQQPTPLSTTTTPTTPLSTTTPPSPLAQVLEERPHNIILEEIPWILPGSSELWSKIIIPDSDLLNNKGAYVKLSRVLEASELSHEESGFITDLTNSIPEPPFRGALWGPSYNSYPLSGGTISHPGISPHLTKIIDASTRSIKALTEGNLAEYRISAERLQNEFNDLNRIQQRALDRSDAKLSRVIAFVSKHFRENPLENTGFFGENERDFIKIAQDATKYKQPFLNDTYLIQFIFLVHRVVRTLEVERAIEEFLGNAMPIIKLGFGRDTANIIRGMVLTDLTSTSHSNALMPYQTYMESIYSNLLKLLNETYYDKSGIIMTERIKSKYGSDHYDKFIFTGPNGENFLSLLRNTVQQHHDRLERAIAQSRKESDALCAQLEEHDEQLIGAEGLRAEINIILNGYEIDVVNPIVSEFGLNSEQHKKAIKERSALEQIVRDLNSQDEVRIQQAISDVQQNKTVQQMLADKKLVLITLTCKPFKDSHDKKDDHDDSNGGHGGNDPKPGPSGEARSIESAEARSIVDIPEAGSGFVKAVDDLTGLIAEIKTSIAETAEAERVYRVSSGDCRESKEISFKGFWKWAKGSCKHSHKDYESYNLLSTQRNEKMEKFLEGIEYAVNFIDHLEKENPSNEVGVSSRKIRALQEAKKLFEVINYAKDTNGRGEAIYAYQADDISKNYTKKEIERLEKLLNKIDSVIDREVDNYAYLHNSIIKKISHAAADIVTNTKKYHLAEADAAMKAGNLEDARKHAESAKESIKYDFSPKGVQSYNEGDWENITLESLQQYASEKLDITKASSEKLEFFMRVYEKIIDKYTQTLREEDASCKDCVLKIVTKSKLTDIKTNLDTALEELNGIKTEKSNAQEIHDLLTRTLQEEHDLISKVSDYSFGKILPTLDAYSVILGTEKNLLDSVNLSKLPTLSNHFSIDPEQLRADIDKTFVDMTKVAGIDTQVNALKCGCIAMNNALTGDGQNAAQYLGESLKSRADRCVSGADKFLSAGFEPLLKDMHDKNFYRDKAPDFLSFNKFMCSIRNDNLHNEPHISAPQTVSLPDAAPMPAPPIPNPPDSLPPIHVEL